MSTTSIDFLNGAVKLRLGPSPIQGVGVFAIKDIPKGGKLFANAFPRTYIVSQGNLDKLFPEVRQSLVSRWPRLLLGEPFMFPDVNYQGYMNHSEDPNYDMDLDVALRDIKAGEEVTEDYRVIPGALEAFPFLLGTMEV
jgi:hypothetical protein